MAQWRRLTESGSGQVYASQASLLDGACTPESSKWSNGGGTGPVSTRYTSCVTP
jgi:hypothetical protein